MGETIYDHSTKPNPVEMCAYHLGRLAYTVRVDDAREAKHRARVALAEGCSAVTVYGSNGNAIRGWYMRTSA